MKKITAVFLTVAMVFGITANLGVASATNTEYVPQGPSLYMEATSKMAFADSMDRIFADDVAAGKILERSTGTVDKLLLDYPIAAEDEKEVIKKQLAQYGIYEFQGEVIDAPSYRMDTSDVKLTTPSIFFDSLFREWTVTCGGSWLNDNWNTQIGGDVGDADAFGVGYTNITKPYKSSVVTVSAGIRDQDNSNKDNVITNNRSDGDGALGFGFRLQDHIYSSAVSDRYVGYKWSGTCTYDYDFGSYSGVATGYYIHTYSKATITSISFGLQGKVGGIDIGIGNSSYSFSAFSSDKKFGS